MIIEAVEARRSHATTQRRALAARAFADIAAYDVAIADWMSVQVAHRRRRLVAGVRRRRDDAFGDPAVRREPAPEGRALRRRDPAGRPGPGGAVAGQGDVLQQLRRRATPPGAAPTTSPTRASPSSSTPNPCGIAIGADIAEAHRKAHACDPVSAYGGVVAANRPVTDALAAQLADVFTEVIVAPGFDDGALELFAKKKNLRVLVAPAWTAGDGGDSARSPAARWCRPPIGSTSRRTTRAPGPWSPAADVDDETLRGSAVRLARGAFGEVQRDPARLRRRRGRRRDGAGQPGRLGAARGVPRRRGSGQGRGGGVSDAFFPFADGPELLIEAGVKAIVEPGGSIRDEDVIAACAKAGVTLYFTGTRHFFH